MPDPRRRLLAAGASIALVLTPTIAGTALAVPPVPAAVDDTYTTDEDTQEVVTAPGVLTNDDAAGPGNILCVASVDKTTLHGSLDWNADGSFTYTPSANYNGAGTANYFTYTMYEVAENSSTCDAPKGSTAAVQITVDPVNDAPTAAADSFFALKNTTLNIGAPGVLSNDGDIDGDSLAAIKVNNPTHGVVVLAADGSFSYTPASNYTGLDTFSYKASDGTATSPTRLVTITVTSIPPIATPTPIPTLAPTPTPIPTLAPVLTPPPPEVTLEPGATATPFVPPTPQLTSRPASSGGATAAPSLAPGKTADPGATSGGGFGSPLTILLGVVLLALIVGVAVAMYGPGWLEARRRREG
jgi:VCBS repeat-containing protein